MRTFLDIVNDMLAAGREGNIVAKHIFMAELADKEIDSKFSDTLDLIDF